MSNSSPSHRRRNKRPWQTNRLNNTMCRWTETNQIGFGRTVFVADLCGPMCIRSGHVSRQKRISLDAALTSLRSLAFVPYRTLYRLDGCVQRTPFPVAVAVHGFQYGVMQKPASGVIDTNVLDYAARYGQRTDFESAEA